MRSTEDSRIAIVRASLRTSMGRARYRHTLNVASTAAALASRWGVSLEQAVMAAWLHDCAKDWTRRAQQRSLRRWRVRLDTYERVIPALWHAILGAEAAKREYGVQDAAVLRAIRRHTTGDAGMTPLEMILYVADFVEPGRRLHEAARLRRLANASLKDAFREVLASKIGHLVRRRLALHPRSLACWNWTILKNL